MERSYWKGRQLRLVNCSLTGQPLPRAAASRWTQPDEVSQPACTGAGPHDPLWPMQREQKRPVPFLGLALSNAKAP